MSVKRERFLILVRHAHRDTFLQEADNGLSDRGRSQVESLKRYFEKDWLDHGFDQFLFLSSPKRRCIETIEPVAHLVNQKVHIEYLLNEHESSESYPEFSERIEKLKKNFQSDSRSWVCCSHGDWIPEFIEAVQGVVVQIKKSGILVLKCSADGVLRLEEGLQQAKN